MAFFDYIFVHRADSMLLSILCNWPSYHLHIRKQSGQYDSYFSGLLL